MSRFIKALLAHPFRFKFSIDEDERLFLDVGIALIAAISKFNDSL